MKVLRPHLDERDFVDSVRRMSQHGYQLAYLAADGVVQAVAGYRITEMLRTGRMMEVDDLVSAEDSRSRGYGQRLLKWCEDVARENHCSVIELDSAVHRTDAHRFYFRERMHILGFHFSKAVR